MRRFKRTLTACALVLTMAAGTVGWAWGEVQTAVTGPPPGTAAWTADRVLGRKLPDPASAAPAHVARFFAGLTAAQRELLGTRHPLVVGNLDGAPPELRYAANTRALAVERSRARARAADPELSAGPRRQARAQAATYGRLLAPGHRVLAFDPRGRGQVAEVYGDLRTARRAAVVVPGSDTDLASYDVVARMARDLRAEMARLSPDDRPAVIAWVGYTTPVGVGYDAATGRLAEQGAPRLVRLLGGLAATTRPVAPPAVFCHSYGSVLCGSAAHRLTGRQLSDLVVAASPGGMEGHYQQDLETFQRWGFDYVKIDWCGGREEGLDPETTYKQITAANEAATAVTGRKLVLSFCEWGTGLPWNWAPGYGDLWRTSTDIIFWGQTASTGKMLANFDKGLHPAAQHTGYYNDPDMLMVGMNGLNAAQNRLHMSLWAISGAPLLAGNNLATMSTTTRDILTNSEVVAINQDARGLQGVKVAEDTRNLQVYGKVLSGTGQRAVLLLNRTGSAASMTVRWADLGLTTASASVRDVWAGTSAGSSATGYTTTVPANDAVLLTVSGTEASGSTYEDTATATTPTFTGVTTAAAGTKLVDITYANGAGTARKATIQVNGQYTYVVAFPPTGSATTFRTVSVLAHLGKGNNTVRFAPVSGSAAPDIDAVRVQGIPGTDGVALAGAASNRCVDFDKNTITNLTQAQIWDCSGGRNQTFTQTSRGELVVYGNKCLDADNNGTSNGTRVIIWDCSNGTNQKWTVNSDGTITNNLSGLCLDATGAATANGTKLALWTCNGQNNQKWTVN
ncbi:alpha/beta hydrolase [Streptomyces sp. TG1A-60]|uniref:alpha/beta hydrolase n=1 Tax=Streptomyces sp. TG1A-60 TaxID=3129111 RepID=UPI0030D3B99B